MFAELYAAKTRKNLRLFTIVATDKNGCIGKEGKIPWSVPSDMKRFRRLTKNHPVIMGRKTFESMKGPLQYRTNIIVSHTPNTSEEKVKGVFWVTSLGAAIDLCPANQVAYVCGGAEIYKQFLPLVDVIHHTMIDTIVEGGDTKVMDLPQLTSMPGWFEVKRENYNDDGDEFQSAYMVHARTESVLKTIGFDING